MDTKDNITATAQEPVQDAPTGRVTREQFLARLQELRELNKQLEGTGRYVLLPTDALTLRAEAYFNLNAENITRLLETSGIDVDTTNAVIADYVALLAGVPNAALPLSKQAEVLNTVKPWRVQLTERYALTLLFRLYLYNTQTTREYINGFKLATGKIEVTKLNADGTAEVQEIPVGVEEQKRHYIDRFTNRAAAGYAPLLAVSYVWISRNGYEQEDGTVLPIMEPSDFVGVEPEQANKFYSYLETYGGVDEYVIYYYIAKYALKATAEELKEIATPPIFGTPERAQEYAERVSSVWDKNIQDKAAEVERMIDAETVEEREKARQELTATPEPQETIRIPETFALLGSRDVYASVDGTPQMAKGILPIQAFITDYMTRHKLTEQVTPRTVEKVIEGVNLLQRLYNVKPNERGQYTFETNISEFAGLIGFDDANQTEKMEIMRALQILDGLYLAVWRSNGLEALRVFNIQRIGLTGELTGKLTLQVNADAMKGRPNLISYKDFDAMRKASKGQAENHFRYQILSKGQKEENALLNEVFGYDTLLKEIQVSGGTADEITKAKRNIDKHKSRDKRRLASWFEDYKTKGWLTSYTYTKNGKKEYIYKWQRGNIPQAETATATAAPDEQ